MAAMAPSESWSGFSEDSYFHSTCVFSVVGEPQSCGGVVEVLRTPTILTKATETSSIKLKVPELI
jgi:hypothetical protein